MRPLHLARLAALAGLVASLAGCGSALKTAAPTQDLTTLDATEAQDVAQQVAVGMVTGMDVPVNLSTVTPWARSARTPKFVAQPTALDTTIVGDGVIWQVSAHLYDALGNEQDTYDPLTSYRMTVASWVHGDWADGAVSASVGSRSLLEMRGLGVADVFVDTDGSRSDTVSCSFVTDSLGRHYRSVCAGTLRNVIREKPFAQNPYPTSGTVTWSVQVDKLATQGSATAEEHWNASAVVTFNGSRYVPLVVNGMWSFTLDLETGVVVPATT